MVMSLWPRFLAHPVDATVQDKVKRINQKVQSIQQNKNDVAVFVDIRYAL